MEQPYHIVSKEGSQELAHFLVKNGQALLPMVELIAQAEKAVDELVDQAGQAMIEAVLRLSAEGIAGSPHPGKKGGTIGWHGEEKGTVCLKERKLRVQRPRLRKKGEKKGGEVPIPAYAAMQSDRRLGSRIVTGHNLCPRFSHAIFGAFCRIRFGLGQEVSGAVPGVG